MNDQHFKEVKACLTSGYVLEQHTPIDVARAMIESGQQKQAFYIFNMDEVYHRVQHFKKVIPRIKIFYAMKANDTDMMLRVAVALGLGFDCASPNEIYKLRKLNVNPKSIIYAMPCKTPREMEYARKTGVNYTTFDSSYELKKIKKYWPGARLLIRIRVDGKSKILSFKYGCDFHTEATELLDEAASLGLKVVGVAFHVGGVCFSPESYVVSLHQARALFDYEAKAGRRMNIVNIGGGFLSDKIDRIDEMGQLVNDTLEELFPDPDVQVVAEPGRYLSDSAFMMFFSVMGVRQVLHPNNELVNMIYVDNGKYMTMKFDENWHEIIKIQRTAEVEPIIDEEVMIWGPSGDSLDRIMKDRKLRLPRCVAGDWLMIPIHGAYTFTFSTRFSSMEIPLIRRVVSKKLWNYIKESSVFAQADFVPDSDVSAPLPLTLPLILPKSKTYEHYEANTLQI